MIRDDKNVPPEEKIMKDELIAQLAGKIHELSEKSDLSSVYSIKKN